MKKFLSLVRLLFVQQYRNRSIKDNKKRSHTIILFVVLGICVLPMAISFVSGAYLLGLAAGADESIGSFLLLLCQGLVLIFGLLSIVTTVFNNSDADRLLFLPIKPTTIFLAKLTVVYLNELISSVACFLMLLLPFGIGANAPATFYLMLPITLLMLPVLPLVIGSLIAMPFSALLAKFKNSGIFKTVMQIGLFVLVMALYMVAMSSINGTVGGLENVEDMQDLMPVLKDLVRSVGEKASVIHCNLMLATAMLTSTFGSWVFSFVAMVVEYAILVGLLMLLAWPFYRWILSSSLEVGSSKRKSRKGETIQIGKHGVVRSLVFTDLKRTLRHGQMGFQSFAGLVIMPLVVVLFYFSLTMQSGDGPVLEELLRYPAYQAIAPMAILAYMTLLGIGSNVLGVYPISRENNSLYLIKSLPVPFSKILLAKVVLATAVMLVCDFVTCLFVVILLGVKWYFGLGMMVLMSLLGFGGMCITTLYDLKSPKLGWTNFNQSLKNATNSWVAMLIGLLEVVAMAIVALPFLLVYLKNGSGVLLGVMWVLLVVVSGAFAVVCYKVMSGKAARYFEEIDA